MGTGKENCGMQKDDVKRRIEHKSADKLLFRGFVHSNY